MILQSFQILLLTLPLLLFLSLLLPLPTVFAGHSRTAVCISGTMRTTTAGMRVPDLILLKNEGISDDDFNALSSVKDPMEQ